MRPHFRRCHALETDIESDCNCDARSDDLELMLEATEDDVRLLKEENARLKSQNAKFKSILEACHTLSDVVLNQLD